MKSNKISAIVIAKNEEEKISDCLTSLSFADEVVVVDTGSNDTTIAISEKQKAKVFEYRSGSYQDWRNHGLKKAKYEWVLYVDADERVSPLLRKEIQKTLVETANPYTSYAIPRRNIILGKEMKHGGWYPDYVKRLFLKDKLKKWTGDLHEEPEFGGEMGYLEHPLIHIKHDNLHDMVEKTNKWSVKEAKLLHDAKHPKIVWWRLVRIMMTELWLRLIRLGGYKDGTEGVIYAIYQMWSKFVTYAKLWEMQKGDEK